ncbi:type VII toxin-antitoxin system MntA family adenylyltransferase antitoxin [Desulfurispira natronophila]|uniref:Putative nucleotidyltransferase n=1 Tax=Desulfurispira natronophila TaxID=682562 RepID=A0A7W7Y591_9BACT|nr:nucleotidyltransferase domain-containing protein [Desulfurispira natronophila]MBB5022346.1 putative nucleotidyltransferase [Desulfurispira natronophila]
MKRDAIVNLLQTKVPNLLAIYTFGSRVQQAATSESDLDLAVLVEGYVDPLLLWELSGELATLVDCDVDLLDMRAASTVMQYQVIVTAERWWTRDVQAGIFEAMVLSEKTELDCARADLLEDIRREGKIYG